MHAGSIKGTVMEPSRALENAWALKETRVKEIKHLTFTQLSMIIANDNELEQEYVQRETVTASRIREVLRDSCEIRISRSKSSDLRATLLRRLAKEN